MTQSPDNPHAGLIEADERRAFENFVLRGTRSGEDSLLRDSNGDYELGVTRGGWAAWQARAYLALEEARQHTAPAVGGVDAGQVEAVSNAVLSAYADILHEKVESPAERVRLSIFGYRLSNAVVSALQARPSARDQVERVAEALQAWTQSWIGKKDATPKYTDAAKAALAAARAPHAAPPPVVEGAYELQAKVASLIIKHQRIEPRKYSEGFLVHGQLAAAAEIVAVLAAQPPQEPHPHAAAAGVEVLAERVRTLEEALREAERFLDYFANDRTSFVGGGTPQSALVLVRNALKGATNDQ